MRERYCCTQNPLHVTAGHSMLRINKQSMCRDGKSQGLDSYGTVQNMVGHTQLTTDFDRLVPFSRGNDYNVYYLCVIQI